MPRGADDEQALTEDIIALAKQYGRYGYRRVTALLRSAGWAVNRKRVERIWRREVWIGLEAGPRQNSAKLLKVKRNDATLRFLIGADWDPRKIGFFYLFSNSYATGRRGPSSAPVHSRNSDTPDRG